MSYEQIFCGLINTGLNLGINYWIWCWFTAFHLQMWMSSLLAQYRAMDSFSLTCPCSSPILCSNSANYKTRHRNKINYSDSIPYPLLFSQATKSSTIYARAFQNLTGFGVYIVYIHVSLSASLNLFIDFINRIKKIMEHIYIIYPQLKWLEYKMLEPLTCLEIFFPLAFKFGSVENLATLPFIGLSSCS